MTYQKSNTSTYQILENYFGGSDNYNDRLSYFQGGLITHFWLPRVNEKLYLRTGILLSTLEVDNSTLNLYKFPLQIEYQYSKTLIKPKIAFVINIFQPV